MDGVVSSAGSKMVLVAFESGCWREPKVRPIPISLTLLSLRIHYLAFFMSNRKSGLGIDMLSESTSKSLQPGRMERKAADTPVTPSTSLVAMRSTKGMAGLLLAEIGGSMVEMDVYAGLSSGYKERKGRTLSRESSQ